MKISTFQQKKKAMDENKRALIKARISGDEELQKTLSQEHQNIKNKRFCLECGIPIHSAKDSRPKSYCMMHRPANLAMKMKRWIALAIVLITSSLMASGIQVTNPAPVVKLGWTASPDITVDGYNLYWGSAQGNYTNFVPTGNVTNFALPLPYRGSPFYFAVTATASSTGLQSPFSNEVTYTPKNPPGAPTMLPPVTLVVQSKPKSDSTQWADAGMDWSLSPDQASSFFRLRIVEVSPQATPQAKAIRAVNGPRQLPPMPGQ